MNGIEISAGPARLTIPERELELSFTRSSGPGGQHVNTSSTKVELRFDVRASGSLSPRQRDRIIQAIGSRLTGEGVLILTASEHRSQTRNREAVLGRFANLMSEALRPARPRRATLPSRAARRRTVEAKKRRAETKALRKRPKA